MGSFYNTFLGKNTGGLNVTKAAGATDTARYNCPADRYALIFLTYADSGAGATNPEIHLYNASRTNERIVTKSGASYTNSYLVPGMLLIRPGETMNSYLYHAGSTITMVANWQIFEFAICTT